MYRSLIGLLFACALPAQVSYYTASLDGGQEVPAVATPGSGVATVRLQEPANNVRIFVHYENLSAPPVAAHLHLAPAGANGGVIVPLAPGPGANTFVGTGTLSAAQVTALKSAGTYVNVHTGTHPGGEIRGQVVEPRSTRFVSVLDGGQETPPVATAATGFGNAYLHEPDNRLVYCVESTGLVGVVAAHVHAAPIGVAGGVVFPLNGSGGVYCGVSRPLTAAQVATLMADGFYYNIHTAAHPGGEIRGQLIKDPGSDFSARIDGAQEVPPVATAGVGAGSLHIDKQGVAHVTVSFTGLSGSPVAAHIHQAPIGSNGGVVVPLALVGGKFTANFTPTAANLTALRAGNWYVNVHTALHPGGEIRGQLMPAVLPTTFGPNCPTSGGSRPEIGATGFAGLGASVEVDLYGGVPGGPNFLALGLNRDTSVAGPLPLPFTAAGLSAPCFFLVDPVGALLAISDPDGCAERTLNMAFAPGLAGLSIYGQWILLDPAANPAGLVASNAITLTLQ